MRRHTAAFTILEIVVVIVVGAILAEALVNLLQLTTSGANRVTDMSLNIAHARALDQTLDHLLIRAVNPGIGGVNGPIGNFGPPKTPPGDKRGIWFYAKLDNSPTPNVYWVWIWLDWSVTADQQFFPFDKRYSIKLAAFLNTPTPGEETDATHGASFGGIGNPNSLYSLVNGDPNAYLTIASDCESSTAFNIIPPPPQPAGTVTAVQVTSGFFIDRSQSDPPWLSLFAPGTTTPKVPYDLTIVLRNLTPTPGTAPLAFGGLPWSISKATPPNQFKIRASALVRGGTAPGIPLIQQLITQ